MRTLAQITNTELRMINWILKDEYNHIKMIGDAQEFEKKVLGNNVPYSGRAIIKIGEYLKSVNIKI